MAVLVAMTVMMIAFSLLGMAALAWGVDSSASSNDPRRPADHPGLT
jgi:hypothetical protein